MVTEYLYLLHFNLLKGRDNKKNNNSEMTPMLELDNIIKQAP